MFGSISQLFSYLQSRFAILPTLNFGLLSLLLLTLASCNSVSSSTTQNDKKLGKDRTNFAYMLPTSVVPIQLLEINGRFVINALTPKYHGDAEHFYYGYHKASVFSSDTVEVEVGANGLLSSVIVTADDRTGNFLINLAKSLAAVKSGFGSQKESSLTGATPIALVDIDPEDSSSIKDAEAAMNSAVHLRIHDGISKNCSAADENKKEICKTYRSLRRNNFRVELDAFAPKLIAQKTIPDCSVGICFRLPIPYRISAGFVRGKRISASSVIVPLPNGGPIVATTFDRALFVKKVTTATFTNGMLTSLKIEKPSEAEAIALLPATIIAALFETITNTFGSRERALKARAQYFSEFEKLREQQNTKESNLQNNKPALFSVVTGSGTQITTSLKSNVIGQDPQEQPEAGGSGAADSPFENQSTGCADPNNCNQGG